MTAALHGEEPDCQAAHLTGLGWRAEVMPGLIYLAVNPDGDRLPEAVDALLTPQLQHMCSVTPMGEDEYGWDLYVLCNEANHAE